jgi:hypothetical protein
MPVTFAVVTEGGSLLSLHELKRSIVTAKMSAKDMICLFLISLVVFIMLTFNINKNGTEYDL